MRSMSKKFYSAKIGQVIVELFAEVGRKTGANWGDHNGAYTAQRTLLSSMMERQECVPVMFDSFGKLQAWAEENELTVQGLGNFSQNDVVEIRSTVKSSLIYRSGYTYLWVRAAWLSSYRDAFLAWMDLRHRQSDQLALHSDAIIAYADAIGFLEDGTIRSRLSRMERKVLIDLLDAECEKHKQVHDKGVPEKSLFKYMDMGIDADHVVNKSSLANNAHAWVMLFPVPAHINRRFGAIVEARLGKGNSQLGHITLQERPLIWFKIFGNFMPRDDAELETAMCRIRKQIGPSGELDALLSRMERDVTKYLRAPGRP